MADQRTQPLACSKPSKADNGAVVKYGVSTRCYLQRAAPDAVLYWHLELTIQA